LWIFGIKDQKSDQQENNEQRQIKEIRKMTRKKVTEKEIGKIKIKNHDQPPNMGPTPRPNHT